MSGGSETTVWAPGVARWANLFLFSLNRLTGIGDFNSEQFGFGYAARVKKAEHWPWSSAHAHLYANEKQRKMLSPWPMTEPRPYRQ